MSRPDDELLETGTPAEDAVPDAPETAPAEEEVTSLEDVFPAEPEEKVESLEDVFPDEPAVAEVPDVSDILENAAASAEDGEQDEDAAAEDAAAAPTEQDAAANWFAFLHSLFMKIQPALPGIWAFIKRWAWVVPLFGTVILIGYYTLFPSRGYFHSDTTDTLMWAIASHDGGKLLNPEFNYACLLPFGTSLIMQALIPITGITMKTHVIGMLIFMLLFTGALIWMLRKMKWKWGWISIAVFTELLVCSGSDKLREIFWGHTIYYSLDILFIFVGLALLFGFIDWQEWRQAQTDKDKKKTGLIGLLLSAGLVGIWYVLTSMDQIISIAIFALPVMGAFVAERWLDHESKLLSKKNLLNLAMLAFMGVCMLIGFKITAHLAEGITAGYEGAFSNYSPMEEWKDHLLGFPVAWFTLLGASMRDGDKLMSVDSVKNLLVVITGVVVLVIPVFALACYGKIQDRKARIVILTHWLMTMVLMMGYIMGKLSSANWRLSPLLASATVCSVVFLHWAMGEVKLQRIISLMMVPVVLVCCLNVHAILKMHADNRESNILYTLANGLRERGLTYGYANFWRANGVTIVADNEVQCRSVNIAEGGTLYDYKYQGLNKWYEPQEGQDTYFLLMDQWECDQLTNTAYYRKKSGEFMIEGYHVWIYNVPLFENGVAKPLE